MVRVLCSILIALQVFVPLMCVAKEQNDIKDAINNNKSNNSANLLEDYVKFVFSQIPSEEIDTIVESCSDKIKAQKELKENVEKHYNDLLEIHNNAPEELRENVYKYWYYASVELNYKHTPDYVKVDEYLDQIEQYYKENLKAKTKQIQTTDENTGVSDNTTSVNDYVYLSVANIEQNPELPTGCEAVAATIVLNYYGAGMSKTELVDNYLVYADSPSVGFVGSPYEQPTGHGHWCTAQPIVNAMNTAISVHGLDCTAVNVTGSSFETILAYVNSGHPVVFWGLENMSSGYHTLVLIGYDTVNNICYFADPLKSGIQTYDMNATKRAYNNRGKQAIIVQ